MTTESRWTPVLLPAQPPRLIVRKAQPENLEFPMTQLNGWLVPNELFYRRNHFAYPPVDPGACRLSVGGAVTRPLSFTLADLRAMPRTSRWVTLECSGNKRAFFTPKPEGEAWEQGAIGNAEWGGVLLAAVLERAGVKPGTVEVLFTGADQGRHKETGQLVHFARSLPLTEALGTDALLALDMNGEPLPQKHGGPVRLLVPGWYGMASVKWLTAIEALTEPFRGPFQANDYVYKPPGVPVTRQKVNSAITYPAQGARLKPGVLVVRGAAWSGADAVTQVEVSLDSGNTWSVASFVGPAAPGAWRLWEYRTPSLPSGQYRIMARATDVSGAVQPMQAPWNQKGYGNNSIARVDVTVGLFSGILAGGRGRA